MRYLYDADAAIDYREDLAGAATTLQTLLPAGIAVSGITLIELYTGVHASSDPRRAERQLQALLGAMSILRLNQRVIHQTARLRHDLLTRKLSIRRRAYDLIVAATALTHDLTLVTSNTRDYQDITGLRVIDPRTQQHTGH